MVSYSKEAKIYVADNCSTDDSVAFVESEYPEITLILNKENGGFAKGYNDALAHVSEEIYVLLNSDIEVTTDWINPCLALLDSDPEIAAVQPKVLSYRDKTKFEHAGAAGGFLDKEYYPFCQGRIFDAIESDVGQYNENREIFWATGACLFIRSTVFHEQGGFDEDFFAHMEEIDLCWRIKSRGKRIYYCADSTIYHVGGGTLDYANPRKTYLNFRNSLYLILKNHKGWLFFKLFKRLSLDGMAAGVFLLKGEFANFWAVLKAHVSFYGKLGKMLKKRKAVQASRTHFNPKGLYMKTIVFKRFMGGLRSFSELDESEFL